MRPQPRYQKGDKIGRRYLVHQALLGGMGEVYLCLDLESNLPYALKTFQQRYLTPSAKLRAAFENEVATWVALEKHPNIVRCYYMDILDNQPFMVLEWIAGEAGRGTDLRSWLRHGPLDLRTVLDFTIDICRGLIHAQEKQPGIVHRDLKPENILIAQGRLAKITDYGLAQIVEQVELVVDETEARGRQSLIGRGGIAGTPAYMAPEQWRGEPLDERTDIYALGCIFCELLTGQWPVRVDVVPTTLRQTQQRLASMQAEQEMGQVTDLSPTALAQVAVLLQDCLATAREERLDSLAELFDRLAVIYQQQFGSSLRAEQNAEQFTTIDYTNRGMTYSRLQQFDQAVADYERAIELNPTNVCAYLNRATTYAEMRQYDEALENYERAIELDPTNASAYCNRGATYNALQQYDKALTDYFQAIKLDPTFAPTHFNRGNTYTTLQRYDEALADYGRAIELDPTDVKVYCNRGNVYAELQQYREALADYNCAIKLDPTDAENYCNRGNVYVAVKQYDKALVDYCRAIELNPTLAQAYSNRGTIYAQLQQHDKALMDCQRAIELDPTDAQAYFNRGLIYEKLRQNNEALADYSRSIELDATLARPYRHRGIIYGQSQRHEEALIDFRHALDHDPDDALACVGIAHILSTQGKITEATPYLEKANQIGNAQIRQEVIQIMQNLVQQGLQIFQRAASPEAMQQAAAQFPLLVQADFITALAQALEQQVPLDQRPSYEQRLQWLQQIADEQKGKEQNP